MKLSRFALMGAAALALVAGSAHAATYPQTVCSPSGLPSNSFCDVPPVKFAYGNAYDWYFNSQVNQTIAINLNAFRFENDGVPEDPQAPVQKSVGFKVYSINGDGSWSLITYANPSISAMATFTASSSGHYVFEIGNNDVPPNSFVGGVLAGAH
jgi:hypothetical protein